MKILKVKIFKEDLCNLQNIGEEKSYFSDIVKCVVDVEKELIAINAELHSDLEEFLLQQGSDNRNLYGINITLDTFEIEFDSVINPPRNREAGYPRVGRYVADPNARKKIEEVVKKWINI